MSIVYIVYVCHHIMIIRWSKLLKFVIWSHHKQNRIN